MAYVLPLLAVTDAVFLLFQDPELQLLAAGGVHTDPPQSPTFPFLWIEVLQQNNAGGLGTRPGRGSMPGLTLRLHGFQGDGGTMRELQVLQARAVQLLFPEDDSDPLVMDGYTLCSGQPLPEIETIPLPFEELNGVKVQELVTNIDLIVEEIA